jgi:hypothetical protein
MAAKPAGPGGEKASNTAGEEKEQGLASGMSFAFEEALI